MGAWGLTVVRHKARDPGNPQSTVRHCVIQVNRHFSPPRRDHGARSPPPGKMPGHNDSSNKDMHWPGSLSSWRVSCASTTMAGAYPPRPTNPPFSVCQLPGLRTRFYRASSPSRSWFEDSCHVYIRSGQADGQS